MSYYRREYRTTAGRTYINESNPAQSRSNKGPKVKGQVVTLPGGRRFLKSTDYSVSRSSQQWGQLMHFECKQSGSDVHQFDRLVGEVGSDGPVVTNAATISDHVGRTNWHNSPSSIPVNLQNMAVTKAYSDLADGKANVGENLATLGQTVRMLKAPVTGLVKSLHSIYRDRSLRPYLARSVRDLRREGIPEHISRRYLEYVYGWKPLMQDIHNLVGFAQQQSKRTLLLRSRGKGKHSYTGRYYHQPVNGFPRTDGTLVDEHTVRATMWARIDPNWDAARTLNQLGLLNPVSLAWELIPYSFVVDWFVPIGPVLNAFTARAGLAYVDGSVADRVRSTVTATQYSGALPNGNSLGVVRDQRGQVTAAYDGYIRRRMTNWPVPGLYYDPDPLRLASDGSDRKFKALAVSILALKRV